MNRPVLPVTYERIDHWVHSLQPKLAEEAFACVIGILRGGAPLALMVSHTTGVPVAFVRYERATRTVAWDSSIPIPPAGSKVLVCEDIAGAGHTLGDCIGYLRSHGLDVKTMTAGFDDLSLVRPDYSLDGRGYFLWFPWERHAHSNEYRETWQQSAAGTLGPIGADHEFDVYAIDLDGILLPDVPPERYTANLAAALKERDELAPFEYLPEIGVKGAKAIITGRPEMDRTRTEAWLRAHGHHGPRLIMRDPSMHDDSPPQVAVYKAENAIELGCTHFVESDPLQAIHIARHAPLLRVIWWNAAQRNGCLVSAERWRAGTDMHAVNEGQKYLSYD
jgi:hypoxanthine phosphoribosyltransferase